MCHISLESLAGCRTGNQFNLEVKDSRIMGINIYERQWCVDHFESEGNTFIRTMHAAGEIWQLNDTRVLYATYTMQGGAHLIIDWERARRHSQRFLSFCDREVGVQHKDSEFGVYYDANVCVGKIEKKRKFVFCVCVMYLEETIRWKGLGESQLRCVFKLASGGSDPRFN